MSEQKTQIFGEQKKINTPQDVAKMVELMEKLHLTVVEMNMLYEKNHELNEVQPDMHDCFKYSLDEWSWYLAEGVNNWKAVAAEIGSKKIS
jgi:hypothetical protein